MKKNKFINFFSKLGDIITNNLGIIVILSLLLSIFFMMYQKGFKINVDMITSPQETGILIEDRVPSLAVYYARERVPVTIDLGDDEILEVEAKYNANMIFNYLFEGSVPEKDGYVFTHFSFTKNGEPIDPINRITEPLDLHANWIEKPAMQPGQVLGRVNYQVEIARSRFASIYYEYKVLNKGETVNYNLNPIDNHNTKDLVVELRVPNTFNHSVRDFIFEYKKDLTYPLTYDLNGGSKLVSTQAHTFDIPAKGALPQAPGVKMDDHRHVGWSTSPNGDPIPLEDIVVGSETILYAIYEPTIEKPTDQSKGRYLTTYFAESISSAQFVQIAITERSADIDSEIEAEALHLDHFETIIYGETSPREIIFAGQFLVVSKKDKMPLLNNKVLAYTDVNPTGIILIVLMFGVLFWTFIDNRPTTIKHLVLALLLTVITILIFILPKTITFSNYFKNVWDISKELNPEGTSITIMLGLIISGTLAAIGALFAYLSTLLSFLKGRKKEEVVKELTEV